MNASRNLLRTALLGSAAFGVMVAGAQADELSALKGQLEALQSRMNQIESEKSAAPALPAGASFITMRKGGLDGWNDARYSRHGEEESSDRGYTIAITPTADLPAPIVEVTVSGYVKGDVIYDTRIDTGDSFVAGAITSNSVADNERVTIHGRQSRFRIRSRADTSIGQLRTLIEGDFDVIGGGNQLVSNSNPLRTRHLWGEWDVTPNTTIGIGQTWTNFMTLFGPAPTIDFGGPNGVPFLRQGQVRLTHRSGPIEFAVAVENPETDIRSINGAALRESTGPAGSEIVDDDAPDLTARLGYTAPGGHQFQVSGVVRFLGIDPGAGAAASDHKVAWGLHAAAKINLHEMVTLYALGTVGEGVGRYLLGGGFQSAVLNGTSATGTRLNLVDVYAAVLGVSLKLSPTSSINANVGWEDYRNNRPVAGAGFADELLTVHVNYLWQPVSKFRMGVEAIYGEKDFAAGTGIADGDALRLQFGAWFFF